MLRTLVSISACIPDPLDPQGELSAPHPWHSRMPPPARGRWRRRRRSLKELLSGRQGPAADKALPLLPQAFLSFPLPFPLQR